MRRVVVLALLALALPMAAWADTISLTNTFGIVSVSTAGISSFQSQLRTFDTAMAGLHSALGYVNFTTGALNFGSLAGGGTFSSVGSIFDVSGIGNWAKALTGASKNPVSLFAGSFVGTIDWTLTGTSMNGQERFYTLTGSIEGMLYNGREATGTTTQNITILNNRQLIQGIGHISLSKTGLTVVPEPGTLGLLGVGLVGIAGMFRRKLIGS